MTKKILAGGVLAALAVPAVAAGHATISATQPQGPLLTAQRTAYVVRVPNETAAQNTWKVVMYVPQELREGISVKKMPGWKIRLTRFDTGKKDGEGAPVMATSRISWTANGKSVESDPGTYEEFPVRFRNPAGPTKLCFAINQYYRNADGSRRRPMIVGWAGPEGSDRPASCLTFVR